MAAEELANPFLALFPSDDAVTTARETKEKQHQQLQTTLKRVFLISGESKQSNNDDCSSDYCPCLLSHKKLLLRLIHLVTWFTCLSFHAMKSTWDEQEPSHSTTMIR